MPMLNSKCPLSPHISSIFSKGKNWAQTNQHPYRTVSLTEGLQKGTWVHSMGAEKRTTAKRSVVDMRKGMNGAQINPVFCQYPTISSFSTRNSRRSVWLCSPGNFWRNSPRMTSCCCGEYRLHSISKSFSWLGVTIRIVPG